MIENESKVSRLERIVLLCILTLYFIRICQKLDSIIALLGG